MSQHTPEPWIDLAATPEQTGHLLFGSDKATIVAQVGAFPNAARILACINGCAGLNPTAYRECVEALKEVLTYWEPACKEDCEKGYHVTEAKAYAKAQQALQHAEGKE